MTFTQAFLIADAETGAMTRAARRVSDAILAGEPSPCYIFAVDGEAFSYGYDGVEVHAVKHTPKRSAELINSGAALIIR